MFKHRSVTSLRSLDLLILLALIWIGPAAAQSPDPDPTQIPGDQFEPTQIPGDQFEPSQIPGDQFEPSQIPGDQFEPTQIPGDQFELLLHLPLDGSLANRGSLGGEAELHLLGDGSGPQTVEGKFGRALHFDGNGVLALPVDFTNDLYKSATVTAWVRVDSVTGSYGTVFSSGGSSARLSIESLNAYARPGGPLFYAKNKLKPGEWTFVYAVLDSDNLKARVGKGDEVYVHKLVDEITVKGGLYANPQNPDAERGRYVFVGSYNFTGSWPAQKMAIDDVRLYRGSLSEEQIAALANAGSTAQPLTPASNPGSDVGSRITTGPVAADRSITAPAAAGDSLNAVAACTSHSDCSSGFYCAWEKVCHPDRHGPMQDLQLATGTVDLVMVPADQPEAEAAESQVDVEQEPRTGRPVPVGPQRVSGLSGYEGESRTTVDLETTFMRGVSWQENGSDKPCALYIDDNGEGSRIEKLVSECGGFQLSPALFRSGERYVNMPRSHAIQGIAVCSTFNKNNRLKGIRVEGGTLNDDATITWDPSESMSRELTNCSEWHRVVRCSINTSGPDTAATGVVVHYNRGSRANAPYEIVGLSLICRDIGLE